MNWDELIRRSESMPDAELVESVRSMPAPTPLVSLSDESAAAESSPSQMEPPSSLGQEELPSGDLPGGTDTGLLDVPLGGDGGAREPLGLDQPQAMATSAGETQPAPQIPTEPLESGDAPAPTLEIQTSRREPAEAADLPSPAPDAAETLESPPAPEVASAAQPDGFPTPQIPSADTLEIPVFRGTRQPDLGGGSVPRQWGGSLEMPVFPELPRPEALNTSFMPAVPQQGPLPIGQMELADGRMHQLYGSFDGIDDEDTDEVSRFTDRLSEQFSGLHDRLADAAETMFEEQRIIASLTEGGD